MKKCPSCSKEIQSEAIKCKHCGKLLDPVSGPQKRNVGLYSDKGQSGAEFIDSPTKLGGIWNKYWGYIIGIPIIIICIASIILSIADFNKTDRPVVDQFSKPPSVANQSISEQYVNQRNSLMGMSDEQFKKVVDENPDLAKAGVRYEMNNDKMIRYIPSSETLRAAVNSKAVDNSRAAVNSSAADNNRPPVNDETYNAPNTVEDPGNKQLQEELHRQQQQQLKEIYR
jgi:hypothetical protein